MFVSSILPLVDTFLSFHDSNCSLTSRRLLPGKHSRSVDSQCKSSGICWATECVRAFGRPKPHLARKASVTNDSDSCLWSTPSSYCTFHVFKEDRDVRSSRVSDRLSGLLSGKLNVQDIRNEAIDAVDQIKDIQKDLGPSAGALNECLSILEKFIQDAEPKPENAGKDAKPEKETSSGE